jgi:SAM-dependent methyltransferase
MLLQPADLEALYNRRLGPHRAYREAVWRTLIGHLFSQYLAPDMAILDLGCGYGEFINQVSARQRYAMDLNSAAVETLDRGVTLFAQDCAARWPLGDCSLDVVFSSNFFEHLPDKGACLRTWREAWRCLRPGGRLVAMGPNIAALPGRYWDFFDHSVPLSSRSMMEGLRLAGFEIERLTARVLPYTMSEGTRYPLWMLRAYLAAPLIWPLFGKQFLVVACRPATGPRAGLAQTAECAY